MSKKKAATPEAPKKAKAHSAPHATIRNGVCVSCGRAGAELRTSCPGYKTAGELIKAWPKRAAPAAKKGGRKK